MAPTQTGKTRLIAVCLTVTGVANLLRTHAGGALAVALYALAVAGVVVGIVLIFSWAKERERTLGARRATRRWFTPWRRGGV